MGNFVPWGQVLCQIWAFSFREFRWNFNPIVYTFLGTHSSSQNGCRSVVGQDMGNFVPWGQVASFFGFVPTNFHKIYPLCLHTSWASMLNVRLDVGELWGKILSIWSPGGRWTLSLFSFHKTPWNLSSRSTYMLIIDVLRLIEFRAVLCQDMGQLICWGRVGLFFCFVFIKLPNCGGTNGITEAKRKLWREWLTLKY
jgi:hypothetical protein